MGFWLGLIIGVMVGASLGVVLAGLLAGSKREESSQDLLWDQLHNDEAVMDEVRGMASRPARPSPDASASTIASY